MKDIITLGPGVSIRLSGVLEDKLLIVGNSNSGKSRLIRGIAEQAGERLPIFVFDLEGEFSSLREYLSILIVGDDGEIPLRVDTAAKLSRRLVELGASAVLDMSSLPKMSKRLFLKNFLQAMMVLPRKLWGPRLTFIDELHEFCPQSGSDAEARETVNEFMALGRKRGFGLAAATQRIAKIHKDSAAEFNNDCIGRCRLDLDVARACERLDFGRDRRGELPRLKPGQFFAQGPSFEHEDVVLFRSGPVRTTHVKAGGERRTMKPPPPNRQVLKLAKDLQDLDVQKVQEQTEIERLKAEIERLKSKPSAKSTPVVAPKVVEKIVVDQKLIDAAHRRGVIEGSIGMAKNLIAAIEEIRVPLDAALKVARSKAKESPPVALKLPKPIVSREPNLPKKTSSIAAPASGSDLGSGAPYKVLMALLMYDGPVNRSRIAILAGVSPKGSTFRNAISFLRVRGLIEDAGSDIQASTLARTTYPDAPRLPTGEALLEYWLSELGTSSAERRIFSILAEAKSPLDEKVVADRALVNFGSTWRNAKSRLTTIGLLGKYGKGKIGLASELFE